MTTHFSLKKQGITVQNVYRNLSPAILYEHALKYDSGSAITNTGALVAMSGEKTGRSPLDKRVVEEESSRDDVWWGDVNIGISEQGFDINRARAIDYLNTRDHLYVVDAYAGWAPKYRIKIRIICARPYHALFMHNMLIRPTEEQLARFGDPDYVIFNAGGFPAGQYTEGLTSKTSVNLHFGRKEFIILGTQYAGEMKKGVFTIMNYLMPAQNVLSMHCSATEGADGDTSILFGLSGTGKTTLSADPNRKLIGDDEHCWTADGIFNIEGGCYAKVIDLTEEAEPDIYRALRFGSVLENVVFDEAHRFVDYHDVSITTNTRGSYPVEYIDNAKIPCIGGHPDNIIFLTCDAFGVLPPVSRLTPEQAMYHFISGYTAKVAGTEVGVEDPEATFSPCFGGPFLVWHPTRYAELMAAKIRAHDSKTWLVNTGWTGGPFGVGKRMNLPYTRAIIDAIHAGQLKDAPTTEDDVFGFAIPTECPGVPSDILIPKNTWLHAEEYDRQRRRLAKLFRNNFAAYEDVASADIRSAGPRELELATA